MSSIVEALKLGVIGLSGVALVYVARVIRDEQRREGPPRTPILVFAAAFMGFCLLLVLINGYVQLQERKLPPDDPRRQAELFIQEDKRLRTISPDQIAQSLNPTTGGYVWGEFYRYRATVRSLLRQICRAHDVKVKPDEAITDMVAELEAKGVLPPKLARDIATISQATYTAQWGTGEPPTPEQARFVAENAHRVIEELGNQLNEPSTSHG